MNYLQRADNTLISLIDWIGFNAQVRLRIPRFYLVPVLLMVSMALSLSDDVSDFGDVGGYIGSLLGFLTLLWVHFVNIHRKGRATDDTHVNMVVESFRSSGTFLLVRVGSFCLFAATALLQAISEPLRVPATFVEFLLLFYPVLVYQLEPPPRKEARLLTN